MMLLASTSSRSRISASTSVSGTRSIDIAASSALTARPGARLELGGEEQVGVLVAEAGRVVELAEQLEPAGVVPDLLLELAVRGHGGGLALDVALAGGHLEQLAAGGDAPLAHEDRLVVDHRDHHDRTRVVDDVPVELLAVGAPDVHARHRQEAGVEERLGADDPEPGAVGHPALAGASIGSGRRGRRPSARSRAAFTNAANSGCGRSGRLLNSGWAWVPTKNG